MFNYLHYTIPDLTDQLEKHNYKNLVFYIDLNNISRGFYNTKLVDYELELFKTNKNPTLLIDNLNSFLTNIYSRFSKEYNIYICIFFDYGGSKQNANIYKKYKQNRADKTQEQIDFAEIRKVYYKKVVNEFNIKSVSKVICTDYYESDLIPYLFIKNFEICKSLDTLNIILSTDKDLLQICDFKNAIQLISTVSKKQYTTYVFDDDTAIKFLIKKNNIRSNLKSKYIPLLLALSGDTADNIDNLYYGLGIVRAIKMVESYKLPYDFDIDYQLPKELELYKEKLQLNLDLTSFERQISRIPNRFLNRCFK